MTLSGFTLVGVGGAVPEGEGAGSGVGCGTDDTLLVLVQELAHISVGRRIVMQSEL